ncbi:MAG: RNA-binding protein [Rothia sp. (in: high G+C Gram-positive bacteria)]|nr:RNA-binding protein [Rothia sp. (in: high G+C Gram-positive bacteria)]
MGLIYPNDLEAWSRWQANAHLLRRAKLKLTSLRTGTQAAEGQEAQQGYLHLGPEAAKLLFVLDSFSPTSLASLLKPAGYLEQLPYAFWAPEDMTSQFLGEGWSVKPCNEFDLELALPQVQQVLALGHYMALGAAAYRFADRRGLRFVTIQHGLHTPYAPPLAPGSHLLAFSQADADFWISGREDISYEVVGSQLFWEAAQKPPLEGVDPQAQPVFLGQMHGAELPRLSYAQAGYRFCKDQQARYRPHPQEKDILSRLTHSLWGKMGIDLDSGEQPLNQVTSPVVSIFSTGVLEAALRGVPSWVYHPNPPTWVTDFWERYGMNQWGQDPTPAPQVPEKAPALAIAHYLEETTV